MSTSSLVPSPFTVAILQWPEDSLGTSCLHLYRGLAMCKLQSDCIHNTYVMYVHVTGDHV